MTRPQRATGVGKTPGVFGILTAADFHRKVVQDRDALLAQIDDAGLALNSALSAYHLHEWVWAQALKARAPLEIRGAEVKDRDGFRAWLASACPHYGLIEEIVNGTKHCRPVVFGSSQVSGYGRGPYGIGPYGVPYLLIDLGDHLPGADRYLVASQVLDEAVRFWTDLLRELGIIDPA